MVFDRWARGRIDATQYGYLFETDSELETVEMATLICSRFIMDLD